MNRRSLLLGLMGGLPLARAAAADGTRLGIAADRFTLNGEPVFLHGISYYGALGAPEGTIRADLDAMREHGFNWLRLWATWAAFGNDVSAVDAVTGAGREPFLGKLRWLVAECDRRGLVVDVSLSRGNGVTGPPRLQSPEAHARAVTTLVEALRGRRNWYLDLANERNIRDRRHAAPAELKALRALVRRLDPGRLVTASHAGDLEEADLRSYLLEIGVDFLSPHRPRRAGSAEETEGRTRQYRAAMEALGRLVPLHYQEPFRRGYGDWQPDAEALVTDALGARAGGAAGWCLHNGDQRDRPDGRPRRSFDLRDGPLFAQIDAAEREAIRRLGTARPAPGARTTLSLTGTRWHLNGRVTYPGAPAEGLLMNARMVNATFEDRNRSDFDPEANTDRFIARIPEYVAHGIRAFTLCLQGGMPGYEGALNSAFEPDGALRPAPMARVRRVIEACDRAGAAVILGCFYQRQDQVLRDAEAVRAAVRAAAGWIRRGGHRNVLLEIANEFPHPGFDHPILRSPEGQVELMALARESAPGLLVSSSGYGDGRLPESVARASDFLLVHFNGTPVEQIPGRVAALRPFGKAIVCNEDDKVGEEGARAAGACVAAGASWGVMLSRINQYFPLTFGGAADDPVIYGRLRALTTAPPPASPELPR